MQPNQARIGTKQRIRVVWISLCILATATAALFLYLYWGGQRRATEIFAAQTPEIEREIARLESIRIERPGFWDGSVPGNGWDYYTQAFARLAALPTSALDWGNLRALQEPVRPYEDAKHALEEFRPVLHLLRQAQRADRLEIHRRYRYYRQWDMESSYDQLGVFHRCLLKLSESLHSGHEDAKALEILMLSLGTSTDLLRGKSLMYSPYGQEYEGHGIRAIRFLLSNHSLTAEDLAKAVAFVDRLDGSRSTVRDRLIAEDASLRMATLESERKRSDFFVWEENVSWHHLWSARLARAAALIQLKKAFSDLAQVEPRPVSEWVPAATEIAHDPSFRMVAVTLEDAVEDYRKEAQRRLSLRLLRTALAIAWHQADTGRLPVSLGDLVPKYLADMPHHDRDGQALQYEPGKLWTEGTRKHPWTINRTR